MNVTVDDIRSVTPGRPKGFKCDSTDAVRAAQSLTWYCNKVRRPHGIQRYKSSANWKELVVTITAIADNGERGI